MEEVKSAPTPRAVLLISLFAPPSLPHVFAECKAFLWEANKKKFRTARVDGSLDETQGGLEETKQAVLDGVELST